jgi:lipase ATG15
LQLIRYSPKSKETFDEGAGIFSKQTIIAAFLMKMKYQLAGTVRVHYNAKGNDSKPSDLTYEQLQADKQMNGLRESKGPFARFAEVMVFYGLYETERNPIPRYYSIDEVRGQTTFITNSTWGLESIYCRDRKKRFVAVVKGESALTKSQVFSSFICYIVGFVFTLFVFVAFMVWFKLPKEAVGAICAVYILWCFRSVRNSFMLRKVYDEVVQQDDNTTNEAEILYQVSERFRTTHPTKRLCWIVLFLEVLLFFALPLGALFHSGNYQVGILFIFVSIITFVRRYCNSTIAVQEYGTLDGIEIDNRNTDRSAAAKDEEWREKHRLGFILSQISSSSKNEFWLYVYLFFIIAVCGLFMVALFRGTSEGDENQKFTYTDKFYYPGSDTLEYTSCQLGGEIHPPDGTNASLADFAFLSKAAYWTDDEAEFATKAWFGNPKNTVEKTTTATFKEEYEKANGSSPVEYKFFGFPDAFDGNGVGVVSIRGTTGNGFDALSDANLWSAAALAQWIRAIMPLGSFFTPVLQYLVEIVSYIESDHLAEIAYYRQTSAFVKHVDNQGSDSVRKYEHIMITGHSLGGGLAMISGAQQKVPAVALSGPNALISRRTFRPSISKSDLEKYTFNIVPDRDIVPRLDDLSQNYQRINCRTSLNNPIECHFAMRSLCEILLSCGSIGRHIPCECIGLGGDYTSNLSSTGTDSVPTQRKCCIDSLKERTPSITDEKIINKACPALPTD